MSHGIDNYGNRAQKEIYATNHTLDSKRLPIAYEEWERHACSILEEGPYGYISSGAGAEQTLTANTEEFKRWRILPRMLQDVSQRDLSVPLFGQALPSPVLLAPIGLQIIAHPHGELATAKAAAAEGVPFTASTVSSYSLEEIAEVMEDQPRWFQLYWSCDEEVTRSMVQRAEKAGYSAIVLTVDTPLIGWREKDLTKGYYPLQLGKGVANYITDPVFRQKLSIPPEQDMDGAIKQVVDIVTKADLTWEHIALLRKLTNLPILLKGILHPEDAKLAIEFGCDGIVESNHGGRQLDGTIAALKALPEISEAVQGRIPVLFDSGIRRGVDVFKALALGANAVFLGRPYIYGLAVAGGEGVRSVIRNVIADFDVTLALSGKKTVSELNPDCLISE